MKPAIGPIEWLEARLMRKGYQTRRMFGGLYKRRFQNEAWTLVKKIEG